MEKKDEIKILKKENKELKQRIEIISKDFDYAKRLHNQEMEQINFERFARLNYRYIKNHGLINFIWQIIRCIGKIFKIFGRKIKKAFEGQHSKKELKEILKKNPNKKIFLFYPGYDWGMKMYQRPQHMAIHFSEKNILFFYCTTNINDNINGFKEIKDGLYITNLYDYLKKHLKKYTLYMYANMNGCYTNEIKEIKKRNNNILYEYIDDLHDDLTLISKELLERHKYILENKKIPVITTAQYLLEKAAKIRGSKKNILLSTNGVVYEDFYITKKLPIPKNITNIVKQNKPIIGYYGALAKWFDYELIEKLAKKHTDYNILLIGIDYDKSFAKYNYFKDLENVFYIGIVDYKDLINYGSCCSVLTIPFLINEITKSTSPVKVFEYMTMEKPIVTTDLPECRKYNSVLIGKNHADFIKKIELAVTKKDDLEYKMLLKKEAKENTWDKKVEEIINFVKLK